MQHATMATHALRAKVDRDNQAMNRAAGIDSDRELVEQAAQAAGVDGSWDQRMTGAGIARAGQSARVWNPLNYDEDRIALLRKLGMAIDYEDCSVWKRPSVPNALVQEYWGGDSGDEAHAILRAAVAVGKHLGHVKPLGIDRVEAAR